MKWAAVMLLVSATALADPKTAAVHDRQGKAYFDAKQYDAAIGEFEKSYAQDKKPLTLFKIASAYYAKADYQKAIDFYGQYLVSDPNGPYAAQALEFTTIAKKALDDEAAKRAAAAEAARKEAEAKAAADEAQQRRIAAEGHVKNAAAFEKANAWASAGDEYRAATTADGDPAHLLDAAAAYRKQPDHAKASEAYRAYLEKVPAGAQSEDVRTRLAETTRALEDEQKRVAAAQANESRTDVVPAKTPFVRGWQWAGARAGGGIAASTTNPLQGADKGLRGGTAFEAGGFAVYRFAPRIAFRPDAAVVYRSTRYESEPTGPQGTFDSLTVSRGGLAVSAPFMLSIAEGEFSFRVGAGPYVAVFPVFRTSSSGPAATDIKDNQLVEPGALLCAELDFGLISIEVRFSKAFEIGPFGQLADDFETTAFALIGGLAVSFDIPR